jgi:hypothetical protein
MATHLFIMHGIIIDTTIKQKIQFTNKATR